MFQNAYVTKCVCCEQVLQIASDAKAGVILKIYLQKKILLIDTFTEEFYPVYENGIYNYWFALYPSAEGIFLYFKMCSFDMNIYFIRTLIFQNKNLFFIGPTKKVQ